MEKILLAIDAIEPNKNALDFACYLGRLNKSAVTGVFLENLVAEERSVLKQLAGAVVNSGELVSGNQHEQQVKVQLIEKNIALFNDGCAAREVNCNLHHDRGIPETELLSESRFADVLVVPPELSFRKKFEGIPSEFIKDLLKKVECPVVLAPEGFDGIDEIIFTYNGSSQSVFAMKQFTYLFPGLHDKKVTVIQVNDRGEWQDPDKYKMKEWLKQHYDTFSFQALKGDTDITLFDYVFKKKNFFLVMGAYGRNTVSLFFKHSPADLLIKKITQPIFIAHL
jgi:hypothetical protein